MSYCKFTTPQGQNVAVDLSAVEAVGDKGNGITELYCSGVNVVVAAPYDKVLDVIGKAQSFFSLTDPPPEDPPPITPDNKLVMKKARLFELQLLKLWMGKNRVTGPDLQKQVDTRIAEIERGNY